MICREIVDLKRKIAYAIENKSVKKKYGLFNMEGGKQKIFQLDVESYASCHDGKYVEAEIRHLKKQIENEEIREILRG